MKKFLAMLLVVGLSASMLIGCSSTETSQEPETPGVVEEVDVNKEQAQGEMVKIGLGQITSIAKSVSLEGEKTPVGQVDTVMVAAGFDKDGKIVKVTIDTAQTKVAFDGELQLTTDVNEAGKTKVELGADYGMGKASSIGKEWFEQAAALEEFMIGKTVEELKSMELNENKTTDAELLTSVTIKINDYIAGIEKAYNNAVEIGAGAVELGLGVDISYAKSKGYENVDGKETLPVVQVDTVVTVGAFDADGKVAGAVIDTVQSKINFDAEGKVTSDLAAGVQSKNELKEAYGMGKASSIGKEWYEQAAALAEWMEGKTIEEINALEVVENVTTDAELSSSVTIKVPGYLGTITEAKENAK